MRLWVADGEKGLMRGDGNNGFQRIGPPGEALCAWGGLVYCAGNGQCACYDAKTGAVLFSVAVPGGVCALAMLNEWLCALSADADSVTALCPRTGQILCCAPAGMYPRDLAVHPGGGLLAAAGGAAGEVLLFGKELRFLCAYRLPGTVCGVCFLPRGMGALCAVERGEALCARLYTVSFRGVTEEVFASPSAPGCLCGLPGGGCLLGLWGGTALWRPNKKTAFRQSCVYPARIRPAEKGAVICDIGDETVRLLRGPVLYRGKTPLDALPLP